MSEDEVRARRLDADQALAVPATPASAVDGPTGFDPSRECNILDRSSHVCPRHGHSHAPYAEIAKNLSDKELTALRGEGVRGGTKPSLVKRGLLCLVPRRQPFAAVERFDYALTDLGRAVLAIAMEAGIGATGNTDATAEGGDSAGRKASPKGQHHGQ